MRSVAHDCPNSADVGTSFGEGVGAGLGGISITGGGTWGTTIPSSADGGTLITVGGGAGAGTGLGLGAGAGAGVGAGAGAGTGALLAGAAQADAPSRRKTSNRPVINLFMRASC
jgi:hypothetical protein